MITLYTGQRFEANPPQKSPAPQQAADINPKTIGANSGPATLIPQAVQDFGSQTHHFPYQ
jgi:hypothetical protein